MPDISLHKYVFITPISIIDSWIFDLFGLLDMYFVLSSANIWCLFLVSNSIININIGTGLVICEKYRIVEKDFREENQCYFIINQLVTY